MILSESLNDRLKKTHLKITKGRIHILEELENAMQPISAEDLFLLLKNKKNHLDLSTVYRTLELFTEKKLVCKISVLEDGRKLFSLHGEKHCHYLVCKKCKQIVTIESCPIEKYEKKLEEKTGFLIDGHNLYLYGICKDCFKREEKGVVSETE